jgi:hypothetical protein
MYFITCLLHSEPQRARLTATAVLLVYSSNVFGFTSKQNSLNFRYNNYYVRECVKMHARACLYKNFSVVIPRTPIKKGEGKGRVRKIKEEGGRGGKKMGKGLAPPSVTS